MYFRDFCNIMFHTLELPELPISLEIGILSKKSKKSWISRDASYHWMTFWSYLDFRSVDEKVLGLYSPTKLKIWTRICIYMELFVIHCHA